MVYTRRHLSHMHRQTHPSMLCCTQSNDTHRFLLTQGVDSTSVNRAESTKHQRIRTPPTLWCRKFISAYHYHDRLRLIYNNTILSGGIHRLDSCRSLRCSLLDGLLDNLRTGGDPWSYGVRRVARSARCLVALQPLHGGLSIHAGHFLSF